MKNVLVEERPISMASSLTMMGLDFGLTHTGYAVAEIDVQSASIAIVHDMGLVETQSMRQSRHILRTRDDVRRAKVVAETLQDIVSERAVDVVAAEIVTATPYIRPTFSFGVLIGVTVSLGRPLIEVLPRDAKLAAVGCANASKRDVVKWAVSITHRNLSLWPVSDRANAFGIQAGGRSVARYAEHQADALAVIQAAVRSRQFLPAALTVDPCSSDAN